MGSKFDLVCFLRIIKFSQLFAHFYKDFLANIEQCKPLCTTVYIGHTVTEKNRFCLVPASDRDAFFGPTELNYWVHL